MKIIQLAIIMLAFAIGLTRRAEAQKYPPMPIDPAKAAAWSPAVLPGKGLMEHDFLYAGEAKERKVFIVKKGQIVWTYDDPQGKGEISDAVMLSNGNVLIAHQFAVKLIAPDKKLLWNYDAPNGSEIHTAMPIGHEHVLYVQNGSPAMAKVVNIATGKTKLEFELPVKNKSVHGQFRHARITADGKLLVAHMDSGKVCEYDAQGKETWTIPAPGVWGVQPLKNGNVLITSRAGVREVTHDGKTVLMIAPSDLADYKLANLQLAWRLPNGNTVLNNWQNAWTKDSGIESGRAVQALEIAPDKKVVWALRSWKEPNLGPATTIQFLEESSAPEDVSFGGIR